LEIFPRDFDRQTAQPIVGTQLEDQNINFISKQPIYPTESAGAGVAALPGIDDFEIPTLGVDLFLNQAGESLGRLDAQSGRNAVAQEQNSAGRLSRRASPEH